MENSIEEDIKVLENLLDEGFEAMCYEEAQAIEHILSDYKRVLKENEKLKKSKITYEKVRDIQEKNKNIVNNNYIPKKKIKDKIEEIKEIADELYYNNYKGNLDDGKFAQKMAKKLEKVLKESEDNNARKRNKRAKI